MVVLMKNNINKIIEIAEITFVIGTIKTIIATTLLTLIDKL